MKRDLVIKFLLFLLLNFGALAIGGYFTGEGVPSDWYVNLNKAPWTPPGWMFGAAWTSIMICFTFYMTFATKYVNNTKSLFVLFAIQWILNVVWNPAFFYYHNVLLGLIIICALTLVIALISLRFWSVLKLKSILILPYFIWLLIATSLNAYILVKN